MEIENKINDILIADTKKKNMIVEGFAADIGRRLSKKALSVILGVFADLLAWLAIRINQEIQTVFSDANVGMAHISSKEYKKVQNLQREADFHMKRYIYVTKILEGEINIVRNKKGMYEYGDDD